MIPIPYAVDYTTKLSGVVPKLVRCEECALEYVYLLKATASGEGTNLFFLDDAGARRRSAAQAEDRLVRELAEGVEAIPCPACGTIQQHMLPRARQQYRRGMGALGWITLAFGGLLCLPLALFVVIDFAATDASKGLTTPTKVLLTIVGLMVTGGLALILQRRRLATRFDPNQEPVEVRKQKGQQLAVSKEEFLKNSGPSRL
jgi:hypothetical protein